MPPASPPVVSLLGPSGSGKTTLAAALVGRWTRQGRRVGYVKHASHGFDVDRQGKDSARVAEAGAVGVALTGPGGFAYLERGEPRDAREIVAAHFADRDVVVLEGFRGEGYPAVVLPGAQPAARALAEATGPSSPSWATARTRRPRPRRGPSRGSRATTWTRSARTSNGRSASTEAEEPALRRAHGRTRAPQIPARRRAAGWRTEFSRWMWRWRSCSNSSRPDQSARQEPHAPSGAT